MRTTTWSGTAAAVCGLLLLLGCGHPPGSGVAPAGSGLPIPSALREPSTSASAPVDVSSPRCPVAQRHELDVTPQTPEEVQYLPLITVCTDDLGTSTFLENRTDQVWSIQTSTPGRAATPWVTHDLVAYEATLAATGYALLAPRSSVVVRAAPAEVRWLLDPVRTGVYHMTVKAEEKALETAIDKSPLLFKKASWKNAFATCAVTGYQLGSDAYAAAQARGALEQTRAVTDTVSSAWKTRACAQALSRVDVEENRPAARSIERRMSLVPPSEWERALETPVGRFIKQAPRTFRPIFG